MNPIPEQPDNTPANNSEPLADPASYVPTDSSPQADLAALQAIGTLEAEADTSQLVQPIQPPQPTTQVIAEMTPLVSEKPTITPEAVQNSPIQTNVNPFPKQMKSSKKFILVLITAVVLIGGAVSGYFFWQTMQTGNSTQVVKNTSGDQPGGAASTAPADTQSSVNDSATLIEKGADNINDSAYDDSALSDATLYKN